MDVYDDNLETMVREALLSILPSESDARKAAIKEKERVLREQKSFLMKRLHLVSEVLAKGEEVDPWKIQPELVLVETDKDRELVRLLLLTWWSMPLTMGVGRRLSFLVRDKQNGKIMGLVSLNSPVIGLEDRDKYLGINKENRTLAANLGLNGHRVGALPPYNELLGGKLAAMVLASRDLREVYEERYRDRVTVLEKRTIPARLLYVYTTGAYGKSSIYERLKDRDGSPLSIRIGETRGRGVMHITDEVYDLVVRFLEYKGKRVVKGLGGGPSQKLRRIEKACKLLRIPNVANHGHRRSIYLFPHVSNLREAILGEEPEYIDRPFEELSSWWKERWAIPRAERVLKGEAPDWRGFNPESLIEEVLRLL
jgi:hypothetical protein